MTPLTPTADGPPGRYWSLSSRGEPRPTPVVARSVATKQSPFPPAGRGRARCSALFSYTGRHGQEGTARMAGTRRGPRMSRPCRGGGRLLPRRTPNRQPSLRLPLSEGVGGGGQDAPARALDPTMRRAMAASRHGRCIGGRSGKSALRMPPVTARDAPHRPTSGPAAQSGALIEINTPVCGPTPTVRRTWPPPAALPDGAEKAE